MLASTLGPDGRLYVTHETDADFPGRMLAVDLTDGSTTVPTVGDDSLFQVVVTPDGSRVAAGMFHPFSDTEIAAIKILDTALDKVTKLPLGRAYPVMELSPDGSILFVSSGTDQTLTVVEIETGRIVLSFSVDAPATGALSMTADGRRLYVLTLPTGMAIVDVVDV